MVGAINYRDVENERQRAHSHPCALAIPKCPAQETGRYWAKPRSEELKPRLPYQWQELNFLNYPCCLPEST